MYNSSTPEQLRNLSSEFADVQLYTTARAVKANIDLFEGNEETVIKMVLAPKLLEGHNMPDARKKQQAGTFQFLYLDGTGVALGLPQV
jgi:hypothetical protein